MAKERPQGQPISQGVVERVAQAVKYVIKGVTPTSWMGPNQPLSPTAQEGARGRSYDFPVGFNLNTQPRAYEPITFTQLRGLADGYDLLRLVIETRKDQIEKIGFSIRERVKPGQKKLLKDLYTPKAIKVQEFLRFPDRVHPWQTWLRMLLEDMLVVDAATIYPRRTRGGDVYSLDLIDGTTIRPCMDDTGRVPMPPDVAYQQVLKGLPAVDYALNELHYLPRNPRTFKLYGCSPVEQIIMTVNIALRRQISQLQYYTEGNVPEALLGVPETWNPDQIRDFQQWWDSEMEGNTAQRRHAKFVPGDIAKNFKEIRMPALKDETDEWLARVVCYCFSLPPTAFVKQTNRATAQTIHQAALQEGLAPLLQWVKNMMDLILHVDFNSPDLEFVWDDDDEDVLEIAQIDNIYLRAGVVSIDEIRERLGLEPLDVPNLIYTSSGAMTLDEILEPPEPTLPVVLGPDGKPLPPPNHNGGPPLDDEAVGKGKPGAKSPATAKPVGMSTPEQTQAGAGKGEEVGKIAIAPFVKAKPKKLPVIGFLRTSTRRVVRSYSKQVLAALQSTAIHVADQLSTKLTTVQKAASDQDVENIVNELDLSPLAILMEPTRSAVRKVGSDTGKLVLMQLNVESDDAFQLMDADVLDYAQDRAAELVGKKVLTDGTVIDNPNAQWAITDSTRDMLRGLVADALENGPVPAELRRQVMESEAFSKGRAQTIARTELNRAAGQGKIAGARASGIKLLKVWSTADDDQVSEDCELNEEQGPIPLDEPFQSGDDCEPAHPNCRCSVTFTTVHGDDEEE